MPTSSGGTTAIHERKGTARMQNHERNFQTTNSIAVADDQSEAFLTIESALSVADRKKLYHRSNSTLNNSTNNLKSSASLLLSDPLIIETKTDGCVHISRNQRGKEIHPDRISLDRRGLHSFPIIDGEFRLRLLSLQHNLINNLDALNAQNFPYLVFLDIYDNQLEQLNCINTLDNLRVLLIGKNRIRRIEGLGNLKKIEVLDLHGNQIQQVTGLCTLCNLKVLNLAGNQIRYIGATDFQGLIALEELNLRRNKLRKLMGLGDTPNLNKLFVSNNEIQTVEDISILAKSSSLKEISIDNNPIFLNGDCVSFLVSYLPNLMKLNATLITDQVRKAAMAWRRNKESTNSAFMDLTSDVCLNIRREEIISNARTNWELLRSQTKCITKYSPAIIQQSNCNLQLKNFSVDSDLILTKFGNKTNMSSSTEQLVQQQTINKTVQKLIKSKTCNSITKVPLLYNRKINRTNSQDTDNSQNTSSSNTTSSNEFIRLPPILIPIIKKMEQQPPQTESSSVDGKLSGSISSIGPNIDSSIGSMGSDRESEATTSSINETNSENTESELDLGANDCNEQTTIEKPEGETEEVKKELKEISSNITIPNSLNNSINSTTKLCKARNIKSALNTRTIPMKWHTRAATAKAKKQSPNSARNKEREQGGDYLIEICGRYLNVYGQCALRFIDKAWNQTKANDVNYVKFTYMNFAGVTAILNKLKIRFPNVEHLIFKETNIYCLGQLNALAEVQGITSLFIDSEGNPISKKKWRSYAIYRLSHWGLKIINDKEVTEEEIKTANEEYQSLSDLVLWSLPDCLLQPLLLRLRLDVGQNVSELNAKKWLLSADPELKSVISKEALQWKKTSGSSQDDILLRQKAKQYLLQLLDEMSHSVIKLRALDEQWPSILHDFVRNTLLDYSQLDMYMKRQMLDLLRS